MKRCILLLLTVFFSASLFAQPVIQSFSPSSGAAGTTVTISGTNFSSDPLANIVYFGAVRADVTSATATTLTVGVPKGATYAPVSVTTNNLTGYANRPFVLTFPGGGSLGAHSFPAYPVDSIEGGLFDSRALALGDLDGDGLPDLATVDKVNNTVSLYRNTSSGEAIAFEPRVDYATGKAPYEVALGDLDGDGKLDVVVANSHIDASTVSVYRNTSVGAALSFAPPVEVAAGTQPFCLAITDLDGDGRPDIAIGNVEIPGSVSVLRNTTTGGILSFEPRMSIAIAGAFGDVEAADVDGDGRFDLLYSDYLSNKVVVLRNTGAPGNPAFAAPLVMATGAFPSALSVGDIDGDGKPEVAVANFESNNVWIFKNTSAGGSLSFAAPIEEGGLEGANDLTLTDINGDGKIDLLVTDYNNSNAYAVSVLQNISMGGVVAFAPPIDYGSIALDKILAADMNGDGRPDMVVAGSFYRALVYRNRIGAPDIASFTPTAAGAGTAVTIKGSNFTGAASVSFGGIPAASFTVVNATTITAVVGEGTSGAITVTSPSGTGTLPGFTFAPEPLITSFAPAVGGSGTAVTISGANFSRATSVSFGGTPAASFTIVSPAVITAVVAEGASGDVVVSFADGTAAAPGFLFTTGPLITGFSPLQVRVGASVTISGTNFHPVADNNTVWFGAVKAQVLAATPTELTVAVPLGATYAPLSVTTAGQTAYACLPFTPMFSVTGGFTANTFAARTDYPLTSPSYGVAAADWNGDGRVDVAASDNYNKKVSVFRNTGSPTRVSFAPKADQALSGEPTGVRGGDLDGDGAADLVVVNWYASVFRGMPAADTTRFAPRTDINDGRNHVVIGDLNLDGLPDLLTTSDAHLQVMLQTGDLSFAAPVRLSTSMGEHHEACLGDFDGDGKPDIAVVNSGSGEIAVLRNTASAAGLSFAPPLYFRAHSRPWGIATGDLDRDGKLDIVVTDLWSDVLTVHMNNTADGGAISFKDAEYIAVGGQPRSVALGDLNGDGWTDMVVVNAVSNTITVLENRAAYGTLSFGRYDYRSASFPQYAAIADFDGDEKADIAVANYAAQSVSIFRNGIGEQVTDVCVGTTATLASGRTGSSYQWQVNTGSGFQNIADGDTYSGTATDMLQVKGVTDAFTGYQYRCMVNNNSSMVYNIVVRPFPPAPVITPDKPVVCKTGYTLLWSSAPTGNQWYKDGVLMPYETNEHVAAWWVGSYTVTATEYGCTSPLSAPVVMTIADWVQPSITITSGTCSSTAMTFTASVTNGGATPEIQWYVDNIAAGRGTTYTLAAPRNGMNVHAQLTSTAHCPYPKTATSPTVTISCLSTAVAQVDGMEVFEVAPNPTNGPVVVKLKLNAPRTVAFEVVNSHGRVVKATAPVRMSGVVTTPLDLSGQPAGLYFLRAAIGGKMVVEKIVVGR